LARREGYPQLARIDKSIHAVPTIKNEPVIADARRKLVAPRIDRRVVRGLVAQQLEPADHVLSAEALKLRSTDFFQDEGYDHVFVEYEVTFFVNQICHLPRVDADVAFGGSIQVNAQDFGIMKAWPVTKPRDEIRTSGQLR
jgi:hypothetical protein